MQYSTDEGPVSFINRKVGLIPDPSRVNHRQSNTLLVITLALSLISLLMRQKFSLKSISTRQFCLAELLANVPRRFPASINRAANQIFSVKGCNLRASDAQRMDRPWLSPTATGSCRPAQNERRQRPNIGPDSLVWISHGRKNRCPS